MSNGVCSSGSVPGCVANTLPAFGQYQVEGGTDMFLQDLLVAYQLPEAVVAPEKISGSLTNVPSGGDFSASASHTAELQRLAPAPVRRPQWVGYIGPAGPVQLRQRPDVDRPAVGGRWRLTAARRSSPAGGFGYAMTSSAPGWPSIPATQPRKPARARWTCAARLTEGSPRGEPSACTICRDDRRRV